MKVIYVTILISLIAFSCNKKNNKPITTKPNCTECYEFGGKELELGEYTVWGYNCNGEMITLYGEDNFYKYTFGDWIGPDGCE